MEDLDSMGGVSIYAIFYFFVPQLDVLKYCSTADSALHKTQLLQTVIPGDVQC